MFLDSLKIRSDNSRGAGPVTFPERDGPISKPASLSASKCSSRGYGVSQSALEFPRGVQCGVNPIPSVSVPRLYIKPTRLKVLPRLYVYIPTSTLFPSFSKLASLSNRILAAETPHNASVGIPMEVFEKMYLNPETRVKGELRKTFANPTPL